MTKEYDRLVQSILYSNDGTRQDRDAEASEANAGRHRRTRNLLIGGLLTTEVVGVVAKLAGAKISTSGLVFNGILWALPATRAQHLAQEEQSRAREFTLEADQVREQELQTDLAAEVERYQAEGHSHQE